MKTIVRFWSYLAQFFFEYEMFQTKVLEKNKPRFIFSNFCFLKSSRLWYNVEKYSRAGKTTDDNMAHAGYLRLQTHTQNM
jgi:hypothetical protein